MANSFTKGSASIFHSNLILNDNYISNDGGDEGISINDDGNINFTAPNLTTTLDNSSGADGNWNRLKFAYDGDKYSEIKIHDDGHLKIESITDSGSADITLTAATDIRLQAAGGDIFMSTALGISTSSFMFDVSRVAGPQLTIQGAANPGDEFRIAINAEGQTDFITLDADTAVAHLRMDIDGHVEFDGCAAGFARHEETFSITDIKLTGGSHDTDIDFRLSNKIRLEMTDDIAQMNLVFPAVSGNFLIVCATNGDHDVTAWKVWESDLTAATTTDVMWAGGSVPAFTNNGTDIVSFYWDADEQQAYGVASLAFATP